MCNLISAGFCMWEMCQSPAEHCHWLAGHTPLPFGPSHFLQIGNAQTPGCGLHGNLHFRRVASCKYPLFLSFLFCSLVFLYTLSILCMASFLFCYYSNTRCHILFLSASSHFLSLALFYLSKPFLSGERLTAWSLFPNLYPSI